MSNFPRLPARIPAGTKYVLEARGPFVRRYIEYPNGRRIQLEIRKASSCKCVAWQQLGIFPDLKDTVADAPVVHAHARLGGGHQDSAVARWMSVSGP